MSIAKIAENQKLLWLKTFFSAFENSVVIEALTSKPKQHLKIN